ncbi:Heat shock protein HslJ [Sphingomonas sp. NFR04]|nr:Heat shock protein HslJ [Sphingomonas sp. NFR04]
MKYATSSGGGEDVGVMPFRPCPPHPSAPSALPPSPTRGEGAVRHLSLSPCGRGKGPAAGGSGKGEGDTGWKKTAAALLALTLLTPLRALAQQTEPPPREAPRPETPRFDAEEQRLLGDWRITGVAGHPTVPGSHARLKLEGLRISGYTGCNALGGNYRVERGYLTTGGVITTRRACSAALMRQEAALLALLDQRLAVQQSHRGRLLLTGRDAKTLVLVRTPE